MLHILKKTDFDTQGWKIAKPYARKVQAQLIEVWSVGRISLSSKLILIHQNLLLPNRNLNKRSERKFLRLRGMTGLTDHSVQLGTLPKLKVNVTGKRETLTKASAITNTTVTIAQRKVLATSSTRDLSVERGLLQGILDSLVPGLSLILLQMTFQDGLQTFQQILHQQLLEM